MKNREKEKDTQLYIGIDLGNRNAQVSFFTADMDEPDTVSTVPGAEKFDIPLAVCQTKNGKMFYGQEALRRRRDPIGKVYENLTQRAADQEEYREYLLQFIRRLIYFRNRYEKNRQAQYFLAFTVPELDRKMVELLEDIRQRLEIPKEFFRITDYRESFFDYLILQDRSVWKHDVAVFDFEQETLHIMMHSIVRKNHAARAVVTREEIPVDAGAWEEPEKRDMFFADVVRRVFAHRLVSGVYLIGNGFDGKWMKESLTALGPNKRIFIGKSLYTRGACLGAFRIRSSVQDMIYYDCDYKIHDTAQVRLLQKHQIQDIPIVRRGIGWFESSFACHLLYNGSEQMEIWMKPETGKEYLLQTLKLRDFPKRPPKAMYLSFQARMIDSGLLEITIRDEGFGAVFASTGKEWKFQVNMRKAEDQDE